MRPEPKKRIDTQSAQPLLGALKNAFAGLDVSPEAPDSPETPVLETGRVWKMGRVILRREKAHRGGKVVIVVDEFGSHLPTSVIEETARRVRAACGCGGTVKDRRIEVQGDQAAKVRGVLEAEGFRVAGVS